MGEAPTPKAPPEPGTAPANVPPPAALDAWRPEVEGLPVELVTSLAGAMRRLSAAIGTAHGVYHGEPEIAFDRIETIARDTGLPLALHGGTGLSDAVFRRAIALGCAWAA